MKKGLFIIGVCLLGAFTCWNSVKTNLVMDDLLLKNVEALAGGEYTVTPPTLCDGTGNLTCPNFGEKVKHVVQGFGLR